MSLWTPSTSAGGGPWLPKGVNQPVTAPVVAPPPVIAAPPPTPPINTVLPVITGTFQNGQVITASAGTWGNSPTLFTYQFFRNGSPISAANVPAYTLSDADVGANITCTVTAFNSSTTVGIPVTSLPVGPVLPLAPINIIAPVISGTATQGQTLTLTSVGTWAAIPNDPKSYAYQWQRGGGVAISGATGTTYALTADDVGANITCAVTATNLGGTSVPAVSNAIGPIAAYVSTLGTLSVSNVSATGTAPLVLSLSSGSSLPPGFFLQWEFAGSTTPPKNTDSSYTTTTQNDVKFITGNDWANLDTSLGYNTPSGAFAFHCRALIDDPAGTISLTDSLGATSTYTAITNWSPDYTDTISVSVANLSSSAGVNMSRLMSISGKTYTVTSGGATILSRADRVASNGNFYAEMTIGAWGTSGQNIIGVTDAGIDFNGQGAGFWGGGGHYPGDSSFGVSISTITNSTTTATVTTTGAHGLQTGATAVVSGATPSAYNGTFTVTVTGQKTFTYTMLSDPGGSATVVGSYTTIPYGFSLICSSGSSGVGVRQNGATATISLGGPTFAVGDVIGLHFIESSNTYEVYYKSASGGAGGKIGATQTLSSQIPSAYYLFAGGLKTNDSATINFGASAYAMTAPSGSSFYG